MGFDETRREEDAGREVRRDRLAVADVRRRGENAKMATKVLDTAGTLQLIDTGRRCIVRDVRILQVHCTNGCGDNLMHDGIVGAFWSTTKMLEGYHQGCDPNSIWKKDPAAAKLQHDTMKSLLDQAPSGACVACNQFDCAGADPNN